MPNAQNAQNAQKHQAIKVNLFGPAITSDEIKGKKRELRTRFSSNINYIVALMILAVGVTLRATHFDYDHLAELMKVALNVGAWIGLFTGFMTTGGRRRRLHLILVSILVSTSASFFASMLVTLFASQVTAWITSINILASALSCMWMLTHYDEVVRGLDSLKTVSPSEQKYITKVVNRFEELSRYDQKITASGRSPLAGEYWAIREWVDSRAS